MLPASDFIFKKMMLKTILRNFKFQKLMDFNFLRPVFHTYLRAILMIFYLF